MNGCRHIKKRIDEADKPDLLPFDVSEHVRRCVECGRFAAERSALRKLVADGARVSPPVNFDAMLKARLAEVKARRSFWWFGAPGYLRLAAASAGLVVIFFAAEYAGLFSDNARQPNQNPVAAITPIPNPSVPPPAGPVVANESPDHVVSAVDKRPYQPSYGAPRTIRAEGFVGRAAAVAGDLTVDDGGVVLVRGRNGEMDVQMPTVSVGAQPLLYVNAGQRNTRNVGTSF
jgi:hypothetical protein